MHLVTHQTGTEGRIVRRLLIEEGAQIGEEFYLGMVIDRSIPARGVDGQQRGRHGDRAGRRAYPEKIHNVSHRSGGRD